MNSTMRKRWIQYMPATASPVDRVSETSQGRPGTKGMSEWSTMPSPRAPARRVSSPWRRVAVPVTGVVAIPGRYGRPSTAHIRTSAHRGPPMVGRARGGRSEHLAGHGVDAHVRARPVGGPQLDLPHHGTAVVAAVDLADGAPGLPG